MTDNDGQALARLLMDGTHRHVTAEQLHGDAVAANIKVSLATVYNSPLIKSAPSDSLVP